MTQEHDVEKVARFEAALNQLIERIAEDRYVLAIVLVGSFSTETIWQRESLGLWIIEADGVSRRLPSDGKDERVFRILVENGINIHAEVIPRSRFKKMVEGASRTAFSCNFFAERQIVYSKDSSIESWFKKANSMATKDQERELLTFSTWTIHAHRHARKRLDIKGDLELAAQDSSHDARRLPLTQHGGVADHLHRAVVGGGDAQEGILAVDRFPRRWDEGPVRRHAQDDSRVLGQRREDRIRPHQVQPHRVPVEHELGGDDDGHVTVATGGDQMTEGVGVDEGAPLRLTQGGVDRGGVHGAR